MPILLSFFILALVLLVFMTPIAANLLHRRHHDHLISGHPRSPR